MTFSTGDGRDIVGIVDFCTNSIHRTQQQVWNTIPSESWTDPQQHQLRILPRFRLFFFWMKIDKSTARNHRLVAAATAITVGTPLISGGGGVIEIHVTGGKDDNGAANAGC